MRSSGAHAKALDQLLMLLNGSGQIALATSVLDAALSSNVPLKNAANVFTAGQTINAATALTLSDAAGTGNGTITTVAAKNLLLNPGAGGWVSITPSNAVSALDLYQSKASTGNTAGQSSLRISRNGSPYPYDVWFNGGLNIATWLTVSGHSTGSGDSQVLTLPSNDAGMVRIFADVAGPCVQTLSNDSLSPVIEVLSNDADPKYKFAVGATGDLFWGNATKDVNTGGAFTVAVSSNVVTVDTIWAHGLVVGSPVTFYGFTVNSFLNGITKLVATTPSANTFTVALTQADQGATTETAVGASIKGGYDVGVRRTGAGTLALTDGGTGSGTSLTATTFVGALTGNATTATTATNVTAAAEGTDTSCYPAFVTADSGALGIKTHASWTLDASTGTMTLPGQLNLGGVCNGNNKLVQMQNDAVAAAASEYTGFQMPSYGTASAVNIVGKTMIEQRQTPAWDTGTAASKTLKCQTQFIPSSGNPASGRYAIFLDAAGGAGYVERFSVSDTGTVTAATFVGALTGNATNVTGTVAVANGGTGQTTHGSTLLMYVAPKVVQTTTDDTTVFTYTIPANTMTAVCRVRVVLDYEFLAGADVTYTLTAGGTTVASWHDVNALRHWELDIIRTASGVQHVASRHLMATAIGHDKADTTVADNATYTITLVLNGPNASGDWVFHGGTVELTK